jgi:tetratricopeptide (TPR) repeat protein
MLKRALHSKEKRLEVEDLETVRVFGYLYYNQGKFAEAENMYQRVLKGSAQVRSQDGRLELSAAIDLGVLYFQQERLEETEIKHQDAL